ncbi:MAG: DUF6351 family protein, partial [Rubrivivax sp.]
MMTLSKLLAAGGVALLIAGCGGGGDGATRNAQALKAGNNGESGPKLAIQVLSSQPQFVSGGDARISVAAPSDLHDKLELWLNGSKIANTLASKGDTLEGVVGGMVVGENTLEVRHRNGQGNGVTGRIVLTNHPITGPVFAGPKLTPFECRTVESGLGAPIDTQCSVATTVQWFYFTPQGARKALADPLGPRPDDLAQVTTIDGVTAPFIVRVESGTINRSIYRIAVLDDPKTLGVWNGAGWNRRIVYRVGESTAAQYHQGSLSLNETFKDGRAIKSMREGYAYVIASLNVNKTNPNDVLAAETVMMVKEHIIEAYGVPKWLVGWGGSGGAIQQLLMANNYPGLFDGIMPDAAFPDVWGTAQAVTDCRLLNRWFMAHPASDAVRLAFEGHLKNTCRNWDFGNADTLVADGGANNAGCGLNDKSKVYDPVTNPTGARCTIQDVSVNSFGRDPLTGFARRPLDNVGVQYGLAALKAGRISAAQFLDVNEGVGGYDIDGNLIAQRTVATDEALRRAYQLGRLNQADAGLATTPILQLRLYAEPGADIHTIYNDISIRDKLLRSNGRADNQVVWMLPNPALAPLLGLPASQVAVLSALADQVVASQLDLMRDWLDGIVGDPAPLSADKLARHKPASAVDSCWDVRDASRIIEPATYNSPGTCNALYPKTPSPRIAAGGPVADDTLKCRLKPIADADYGAATFSQDEKARRAAVFPDGVCDYSRLGVEQQPVKGTWL